MTQKGYHCAYDMHYHIVFPVKYRKALLTDGVSTTIKDISKRLGERYELKKELWGGEFWTDGYYVATIGEHGNWAVVERYVKNQEKKDNVENLKLW